LTRRLRLIVEFKMPDAKTRGRMWRKLLPEKVSSTLNPYLVSYFALGLKPLQL
jgi:hypothetical protein